METPTLIKLADDLGQITFRIETNWSGFEAAMARNDANGVSDRRQAINSDIEKLKEIKSALVGNGILHSIFTTINEKFENG